MNFYTFSFKPCPKVFVGCMCALLGALAVIVWSARYYFIKTGDLLTEDQVVNVQLAAKELCLYRSGAINNDAAYKFALYRRQNPKIIVVGSSRVLQFGAPMFEDKFTNLGRTINYLAEGPAMLKRIVEYGKPELMLIGVDFWWFNPNRRLRSGQAKKLVEIDSDDPRILRNLIERLIELKKPLNLVDTLSEPTSCHIGILGKTYSSGFGPDGFRYLGAWMSVNYQEMNDYKFKETLSRIGNGHRRFEYADVPDPARIRHYLDFVAAVKAEGINVISFVPPIPPTVFQAMKKTGRYGYIAKAMNVLSKTGLDLFDFHDPGKLGVTDCDFIDGFHAGDTASARILQAIAEVRPNLRKVVNGDEISRLTKISNQATTYVAESFNKKEPDFLGLGCKK